MAMFDNAIYLQGGRATSKKAIPTFSEAGWVKPIGEALDYALVHCFAADASQSTLFNGSIVSMAELYQKFGNLPDLLVENMQTRLREHLATTFNQVSVECKHNYTSETGGGSYDVYCYVESVTDGVTYTSAVAVTLKDSKLTRFFKLSNTGSAD